MDLCDNLNKSEDNGKLGSYDSSMLNAYCVIAREDIKFCRPSCEHGRRLQIGIFQSLYEALLASYQPCEKCFAHSSWDTIIQGMGHVIEVINNDVNKIWKIKDLTEQLNITPKMSKAFKEASGVAFMEYTKSLRLRNAIAKIRGFEEEHYDNVQIGPNEYLDIFSPSLGSVISQNAHDTCKAIYIDTILGQAIAIASDQELVFFEFLNYRNFENDIASLRTRIKKRITAGTNNVLDLFKYELNLYWKGLLKNFSVPIGFYGSAFQVIVWKILANIPYGVTQSYEQLQSVLFAHTYGKTIESAISANKIAILIPNHRITNAQGDLCGFNFGLSKKKWLLIHENTHFRTNAYK